MPEGHSLGLAARRIEPVVGRHVIAGLLAGTNVAAVETRGKHLLVHGEDGRSLHVHLGMNGRVRLRLGPDLLGRSFDTASYLSRPRRLERPVPELLLELAVVARRMLRAGVAGNGRLPQRVYRRTALKMPALRRLDRLGHAGR